MAQGQFINDKQVLLTAAETAGVRGAQELLDDEDQLKPEVWLVLTCQHHSVALVKHRNAFQHSQQNNI